MYLIIDVGNTQVKMAVFKQENIIKLRVFKKAKIVIEVKKIISRYVVEKGIISSVGNLSENILQEIHQELDLLELNHKTKIPFNNLYVTPKTLGVDRIALASAGIKKYPQKNVLIIDAGTCITFDFIDKKGNYLGGAISPGIQLRYKSLNDYTAKLPLLKVQQFSNFIGNDTESSIHSGVINGVVNEIRGVINQYKSKYKDLTVVLTGGDSNFLANQLKNGIFASPNFVLEGLFIILTYNKAND